MELAWFGMGCFWGVERLFWQQPGVYSTAAGYQGPDPQPYLQGGVQRADGHAETVQVVFDPRVIGYGDLIAVLGTP